MNRIAIIAAMPGELKPLVKGWQKERLQTPGSPAIHLWRSTQGNTEFIAACSGPGQQASTRAFAAAEKGATLTAAYSIGWVGALSEAFTPPHAYTVSSVIDTQTGERFQTSGPQTAPVLVTSPRVADAVEKHRLASAYGASLVDMEAAAVARLAAMRDIPFHCLKAVSDALNDELPDFNPYIAPNGDFQVVRLVFFVLFRPHYWPPLLRMGENSSKASHSLRDLLLENLSETGAIANKNGDSNLTS